MTSTETAAATDIQLFAEAVLGRELWDHQLELARSEARYRVICAGRQSGKSTALSVISLFEAVTRRDVLVLLVSAGEVASRRLLEECAALASGSPLLRGSVLDESKSQLTLSNGSRILSVPASQRQIRGWPVDLLVVDEAGFIDDEVWRAAEPAIIARPGSRVILASTPWGGVEHFFRVLWSRGMDGPGEHIRSWHWPCTVSPLVDQALLERLREDWPADRFRREFLAEWTEATGAFFSEDELMRAVADYELVAPERARFTRSWPYHRVCGGVDWGTERDANAVAVLGAMNPAVTGDERWRLYPVWLEARHRWPWAEFISYLEDVVAAHRVWVLASETNGVGAYPTDDLQQRVSRGGTYVEKVHTDVRRKQSGFGKIKMLLQTDRLVLPRHPGLLRELRSLEYEQLAGGDVRIAVPERAGHDDLAMALMQAVSCAQPAGLHDGVDEPPWARSKPLRPDELVLTGAGVQVPRRPVPWNRHWITGPAGGEGGDGW